MEFKEIQEKIVENGQNYGKRYNIKIDEDFALFKLYEEVGELAQAVLIHRKKCRPEKYISEDHAKKELEKEFADVLGLLVMSANLMGVDLEQAVKEKWINGKN